MSFVGLTRLGLNLHNAAMEASQRLEPFVI